MNVMKKGTLLHCWWECKPVQPLWKTVWRRLEELKLIYHLIPQSHSWLSTQIKKSLYKKYTCTYMFTAARFTIVKIWNQPKCPSINKWIKKMWHKYAMEYYSAIKRNKIMAFAATWMEPEVVK